MGTDLQITKIASPGQNLVSYINTISAFSIISAEQETALANRLFFENDLEAARQLVLSHLRFVVHIAKSFAGYGLNLGDLIQEGNIGLMKAVKRFDPRVGVRLISFAVHWIKSEIHEFILKNWRIVKIATTKAQRKLFFNLRSSKKSFNWLTEPEIKSLADDLGVKPETVREMEGRLSSQDPAYDYLSSETEERKNNRTPSDPVHYLADHTSNPETILESSNWKKDNLSNLSKALSVLDKRSHDILVSRWLDEENKQTLSDLAKKYDVSSERIRQIEKNALKKLKVVMQES